MKINNFHITIFIEPVGIKPTCIIIYKVETFNKLDSSIVHIAASGYTVTIYYIVKVTIQPQ